MLKRIAIAAIAICLALSHAALAGERKTVIFDQGHGQRFLVNQPGPLQLGKLAGVFNAAGYEMMLAPGAATKRMLGYADVFVVSGPFVPYTAKEADNLYDFVTSGGSLAVMAHITSPLSAIADRFGVAFSNGVITEQHGMLDGKGKDFHVTALETHQLFNGIESFDAYGAWGLGAASDEVKVIARTSGESWEDHDRDGVKGDNDKAGPFGMIVTGTAGKGRFVFFADDAIFQNRFLDGNNRRLAGNLAEWLRKD